MFEKLESDGIVSKELSEQLKHMVGFRNVAVHDYQQINLEVVRSLIEEHLGDFQAYIESVKTMKYLIV